MADNPWIPWGGCRTGSDSVASLARQAEKERYWRQSLEAAAKPRAAKGRFKKAAEKTFPQRSVAERAQRNEEVSEERSQRYKEETKGAIAALEDQHEHAMQGLQAKLESKDKEIRLLKALPGNAAAAPQSRPLTGGRTAPTRPKLARQLEALLSRKFANPTARRQALYEHYLRHPTDYSPILLEGVNQAAFDDLCKLHPEWLHRYQKDVIHKIEAEWSVEKCLSIQIHSRVGSGEKYQHIINTLAKNYNQSKKAWVRKELFGKDSGVYLPLLKSKGVVTGYREEIATEIPLMQDKAGTAVWADLWKLVEEAIRDDRTHGYLQSRVHLAEDQIWLHWGGDAAGWLRALKHSLFGFKLVGNQRVVAQSLANLRTLLLFEGKDSYENYAELLAPFFAIIDALSEEGITVDGTHYRVKQSMGADYVLLSEVMGHCGHSAEQGCCLCDAHKGDYGRTQVSESGRRVPLGFTARTTEQMAAAAHRPFKVGPDVACPYCSMQFPNQAAVDAAPAPGTKNKRQTYQQQHAGIRFGKPPLFKFPVAFLAICVLHTLLRLCAITFKRTIIANLDTEEKIAAANEVREALKLGCKEFKLKKATGASKKEKDAINFIGR